MRKRLAAAFIAVLLPGLLSAQDICLNGKWECGIDRKYDSTADVPGLALDPTQKTDGSLWYRKSIRLPEGNWTNAVLELKGARFRPSVYVNGVKCSSAEGGMTRTMHSLSGGVFPGSEICLEIELKSLNDVPKEDASFIPEVDQWRSNCSSCLWDDVVLHLYNNARVDRVTIDYDSAEKKALLKYRIYGGGAAEAEITISDGDKVLVRKKSTITGKETAVAIDCSKTTGSTGMANVADTSNLNNSNRADLGLKEWSPESPALYNLSIKLFSPHGVELSEYSQKAGFREFRVKGKHFTMNGDPIGLRGGSVVWHRWVRDRDAKEVAFDAEWFAGNILKRIKEHGGNYIRFHLGVPPERILDLCDSLGLAVQYEWSFFHGLPASYESLVEQYGNWLDVAAKHPSVCLLHPYNETDDKELATAWKALNYLAGQYPHLVLEDRDVLHIHRYWWGMSENLGLYYDSYKQFVKPIVVDEFGGIYLDRNGDMGGYPMIPKGMKRWLGENHTAPERLHQQMLASGKVGEYWRRLGAAGIGVFPIASSFEDGNNWFLGELSEGNPKPVWDVMTAVWANRSVSMDIWDRNFTPGQKISVPVYMFNETGSADNFKVLFSIKDSDGVNIYSDTQEYRIGPFSKTVIDKQFNMPEQCGDYKISAQLLNPGKNVRYPVTSEWEIHVLKAKASDKLAEAKIFIPSCDRELRAMAAAKGLKLTEDASEADLIVVDASGFKNMDRQREMLDKAIGRGAGVVLLNAGSRTLGKSYNDKAKNLGQVSGAPKLATAEITHTDLFAGLSVNCVEVAEPESHLHPAHSDSTLWRGLESDCTRLWNGLRGGLIVPSADIEIGGLSSEAFLSGWAAKGADAEKIRKGEPVYAYEYCGFYRFDDKPDSKETMESLRQQVAFLIEDMPALALSLPIHTPIRITDLTNGYRINRGGRATGFYPMAEAGKDLVRNPVIRIEFGKGEGTLIISQVITEHRLAEGFTEKREKYPLHYDEAAVQFVLNMMDAALPAADNGIVSISTGNSSMVFEAKTGEQLKIICYGTRYGEADLENVIHSGATPQEYYPAYGLSPDEVYMVAAVQNDGNMTLDPAVTSVRKEQWANGEILTVTSKDRYYPVEIQNVFKTYKDEDIIETWTEIRNCGKHPITITRYMSGGLPIEKDNVWVTTFYGAWADECRQCTEPLTRGIKTVKSTQGSSNTQSAHSEALISLDGRLEESHGRVIGAALCWGGNYELSFNTGNEAYHRFYAGICPDNADIPLAGKTSFRTPTLLFSYSDSGAGEVSRNFHRYGRKYRMHNGNSERKIVLNSWEGVHLDLSEPVLDRMMAEAAEMGVETFVLDDGWFGGKYSRIKPDSSLGDWTVDKTKLPHGLGRLTAKADSLGVGFGLWIEPEMTNVHSELYEKHPDWVLKAANREPVCGRGGTQLVLDLCNPEVRDFVFDSIDRTLRENPGINYIKWDCNMTFSAHGSQYLKNQNQLVTQWWKGFEEICGRVREAWPDLTMQLCAAGGGRVNWGVLPWFDEFWTSDNTDALQRIYLQWGTSYFFPALAAGAHISAVPNKATQRYTSLKYRIDVAMSGRLGLEFQPAEMTSDELEQCRRAIAEYKEIRPVIQFGDLYRLVSPYDDRGFASLMYCNEDRAVFFWWRMANFQGVQLPEVRMQGLDQDAVYRVNELDRYTEEAPLPFEGRLFTGKFLMNNGLKMPGKHNKVPADIRGEWSSRVLLLTKVQ